jgi:hypothetical protein
MGLRQPDVYINKASRVGKRGRFLPVVQAIQSVLTASLSLDRLKSVLGVLSQEVDWIIQEIRALRATSAHPIYCIDYDVLFPSVLSIENPSGDETEAAFWSSLTLHAQDVPIVLLPGTLFEILNYAEHRLDFAKGIRQTPFGNAFITSMSSLDVESRQEVAKVGGFQDKVLEAFQNSTIRNATFNKEELYLHSIISRAHSITAPFPAIDKQLFYQCIVQLSQGSRVTKTNNNRVDALNYALLSALNSGRIDQRHYLVSSSHFMRHLDNQAWHRNTLDDDRRGTSSTNALALWRIQNRRFVMSPRRAAIFRLITSAGDGVGSRSAKLAFELQVALQEAQQQVVRQIAKREDPLTEDGRGQDVRSDNVFLQIISSFFGFQAKIAQAVKEKRDTIEVNTRQYALNNPVAFFEDLFESVTRRLREFGYREAINAELSTKPVDLKLIERDQDKRFSHSKHVDALGPSRDLVFSYFFYAADAKNRAQNHLFVSRGAMPVESFLDLFNVITSEVSAKVAARVYNHLERDTSHAKIIVGGNDRFVEEPLDSFNGTLKAADLARRLNDSKSEITFVRINLPWFEMSYEGKAFAFASRMLMTDEVSLFLQETAAVGNRTANFRQLVTQLLRPKAQP